MEGHETLRCSLICPASSHIEKMHDQSEREPFQEQVWYDQSEAMNSLAIYYGDDSSKVHSWGHDDTDLDVRRPSTYCRGCMNQDIQYFKDAPV